MSSLSNVLAVNADTEIGVLCSASSRLRAVTTISSSWPLVSGACARATGPGSIKAKAAAPAIRTLRLVPRIDIFPFCSYDDPRRLSVSRASQAALIGVGRERAPPMTRIRPFLMVQLGSARFTVNRRNALSGGRSGGRMEAFGAMGGRKYTPFRVSVRDLPPWGAPPKSP
jgi:hypothetical protein